MKKSLIVFACMVGAFIAPSIISADVVTPTASANQNKSSEFKHWKVQLDVPVIALTSASLTNESSVNTMGVLTAGEVSGIYDINNWFGISGGLLVGKGPKTSILDLSNESLTAPELIAQVHHEWGWFNLRGGVGAMYVLPDGNTYTVNSTIQEFSFGPGFTITTTNHSLRSNYQMTSGGIAPVVQVQAGVGPFAGINFGINAKLTDIKWSVNESEGTQSIDGGPNQPITNYGEDQASTTISFLSSIFVNYTF